MMTPQKVFDHILKQEPVWVFGLEKRHGTCEVCGGDGSFVVLSKYKDVHLTLDCPCCHGVGKRERVTNTPSRALLDGIYRLNDYIIMARDTHGNSYSLDSIYETKEECQAEIDQENKGNE